MRRLGAWLRRAGGMFRQRERDAELTAELESHVQMHVEEKMRAGMTEEEARREALMQPRRAGTNQRELPRPPRPALARRALAGPALHLPHAAKGPRICPPCRRDSCLGHRGEYRIFSVINRVLLRPLPYKIQAAW